MKNRNILQKTLPHLLVFIVFLIITALYFTPIFEGKTLAQQDIIQAKGAAKEINDYHDKTGKWPLWTNSIFGGMPSYLIGTDYPNSLSTKLGRVFKIILPTPVNDVFLYLVGMYILLIVLGMEPWLAAFGAIAFAFSSYNLINIKAGHESKVIAMGYLPPIIAGVILAFRGRYWLGGALAGLFLALQLYGNHVQITYYLFIALGLYGVMELIFAVREGWLKTWMTAAAVLAVAFGLAVGSHASRLLVTNEYSKESIRGKTDLVKPGQKGGGDAGLDRDYAFMWSYAKLETFTLLIPNFYGGSTSVELGPSSNVYEALQRQGFSDAQARQVIKQGLPLYWGGQEQGTGGPAYAGAIVCFLFVLGMFIIKERIKWWLLAVTLFFISLSWGKYFFLNDILFEYLPFYNKFRAITMVLTVVQVFMVLGAVLAVWQLVKGNITWNTLKQPLTWSLGLTAGVALLFALLGGAFFDFSSTLDTQAGLPAWLLQPLRDDRQALLRSDSFRTIIFILLAAGLIWAYVNKKMKASVLYMALAALTLIDLFSVGKRYFDNSDFITKRNANETVAPSPADAQIMQDQGEFRVLNLTKSPFQDATTSYFHHSIGGYHAAKMQRYQELIDTTLSAEIQTLAGTLQSGQFSPLTFQETPVLNMLNTRYLILPGQQGPVPQLNPAALGNAWLVSEYKIVPNANAEIQAIKSFDPAKTAIIDARYQSQLNNLTISPDSAASIRLTSYAPEHLIYQYAARSPQLAVFSEIYYQGNNDWQAYIDGKAAPHFRTNYVLRGMSLPAGSHKVEFKYTGHTYQLGETIALISSILLLGFVGVAAFLGIRRQERQSVPVVSQ